MKSLGHLKSYDIQLTVQSPLFIGSGEKINKKEFIFLSNENKAIIIDLGRLVVFLNEKNLLEQYQYFLLDDKKKNICEDFFEQNDITSKDYKAFSKYTIHSVGDNIREKNNVHDLLLFEKNTQNEAYIPGSSLKGAFRTAWLAYMLEEEAPDIKNERNNQWLKSLKASKKKSILAETTLRTVNKLEEEYFNTLQVNQKRKSDMVNSIMRGISFSDSTPIDSKQLMLSQKIDLDVQGREHVLPILRECLKPATTCQFTLTLDEVILKGTGIDINQILHIVQWFCQYQIDHFYKKFKKQIKLPTDSKETVLWLGGGVGFANKSIIEPALGENNGIVYTSEVLDRMFSKHGHDKDVKKGVSPHMAKIATYQNEKYVMGQCKLEVL